MKIRLAINILILSLLTTSCVRVPVSEEGLRQPPCDPEARKISCPLYADARAVSLCELIHRPNLYNKQIVRLAAVIIIDEAEVNLFDPACIREGVLPPAVTFDQNYGIHAETQVNVGELLCKSSEYYLSKKVEMHFVGKFNVEVSNGQKSLMINILCIEQVNPIK